MAQPLADAIAALRHRHGDGVVRLGLRSSAPEVWPTGIPAIDGRLAPGGLPQGRLTVLAAGHGGPTGRLTLLQALVAAASRSMDVAYVDLVGTLDPGYLADLGADLDTCLVIAPPGGRWDRALTMARALASAGMPWLGIALGRDRSRDPLWDHALSALVEAVARTGAVCVIAAPSPLPFPLAHASSLTFSCASTGWQEAHGDVVGLRVGLTVAKSRLSAASVGCGEASVLLRYPRPFARGEVITAPTLVRVPAGRAVEPVARPFIRPASTGRRL